MRRQRRVAAHATASGTGQPPDGGEVGAPDAAGPAPTPVATLDEARREIASREGSAEYRFGSHEAVIDDYRLLDAEGRPCQALRVGERFVVELDVTVRAPLGDLAAAIMFRNAQGQNLFGANTRYDGAVKIGPLMPGARYRIATGMEMLLNPGEYLLHLGLAECKSDHVYVSLDNRDRVGVVTVHGKPVSFGLVHHLPRFTVTSLEPAGADRALGGTVS